MKFSDRMGITKVDSTLQVEGMNDALRNSLWNLLDAAIFSQENFMYSRAGGLGAIKEFSRTLWAYHFKERMDALPAHASEIINLIRAFFFDSAWYEVYNLIEFIVGLRRWPQFDAKLNRILEREFAGYRLIDEKIVPVTDRQEIAAVESALQPGPYAGASAHIQQALAHLGNKANPDFRNSIKESISAVESAAREISGNPKATLGDALNEIERKGAIHAALKRSLTALYGYTSDEGGIRHAMLEEPHIDSADAKFFLVACSTFVNYLKAKA